MFETTLLESSAGQSPVLTSRHRIIAMLAGTTVFLAAWKALPLIAQLASAEVALAYSLALGGSVSAQTLMICYVLCESRRLGLGRVIWLSATIAGSAVGFMAFLIHSARRTGEWRRAAMPVATTFEIAALGALLLFPLIRTQALDLKQLRDNDRYLPPPPRSVRIVAVVHERGGMPTSANFHETPIITPVRIPDHILYAESPPKGLALGQGPVVGVPELGGCPECVIGGAYYDSASLPAPPVPTPAKPKPMERKFVISEVQAAKLIFGPKPEYPPMARMVHIQGQVRLAAIIGTDGRVQNLQVLSGHPFLAKASLEAVAKWRYQPTLLNGEPVEVQTEIVVNFILGQ
jgi:protein TonB